MAGQTLIGLNQKTLRSFHHQTSGLKHYCQRIKRPRIQDLCWALPNGPHTQIPRHYYWMLGSQDIYILTGSHSQSARWRNSLHCTFCRDWVHPLRWKIEIFTSGQGPNKWKWPVLKCIWIGSREKTQAIQVFLCNTKSPLTYSSKNYPPKLEGRSIPCLGTKHLNGSMGCWLSPVLWWADNWF